MRTLTILLSMTLSLTAYANENEIDENEVSNSYNAVAHTLFEQVKNVLEREFPIGSFREVTDYQDFERQKEQEDPPIEELYLSVSWNPVFSPNPEFHVVVGNLEGNVPFNNDFFQSTEVELGFSSGDKFRYAAVWEWRGGHFGKPTNMELADLAGLLGDADIHRVGAGFYYDHRFNENRPDGHEEKRDDIIYVGTSWFLVSGHNGDRHGFEYFTYAAQAEVGVMQALTDRLSWTFGLEWTYTGGSSWAQPPVGSNIPISEYGSYQEISAKIGVAKWWWGR